MKELITRALYGAIYVAVVILCVWFDPRLNFLLTGLILVLGIREFSKMQGSMHYYLVQVLGIGFLLFSAWTYTYARTRWHVEVPLLVSFLALIIAEVFRPASEKSNTPLLAGLFAIIYIAIPCSLAPWIARSQEAFHPERLLGIFILIWSNDTFAYLTGKAFGKHPLHQRLSPKKSIEGFLGGLILTVALAGGLSYFWTNLTLTDWLILGTIISLFSTIGDLFESAIKRISGVKDSGTLMPGHGGVLDRLDSFLFVVPAVYLYLSIFTS